jgi:hypothetical protein
MNEQMATEYGLRITNAIPGWSEDATVELIKEIQSWHNLTCAEHAVDSLCRTWTSDRRPTLGKVIEFYNDEMDVFRRREAMRRPAVAHEGPVTDPVIGREIAFQEYRKDLGLPDDEASRERFRDGGVGAWDRFVVQKAPDEEVVKALAAIGTGVMYGAVLQAFGGDHLKAGRALRTLTESGRIVHENNGWVAPVKVRR